MGNRESSLQDHHCAFYSESHPNPEKVLKDLLSPCCYLAAMITLPDLLLCNPDSRQGVTNAGKKQCKSAADSGNGVSNQPVRERRKIAASKENPTFLDPDHCGYRRYHMIL